MTDKKAQQNKEAQGKEARKKEGKETAGKGRKPRGRPPRLKGIPGWGKTGKKQLPRLKGGLA